MKTTIRFNDGHQIDLECDAVAYQEPGVFVIVKNDKPQGMFPIHSLAGIWHPDGPNQVQLVKGIITTDK